MFDVSVFHLNIFLFAGLLVYFDTVIASGGDLHRAVAAQTPV
jgi:hypothetical protein